MAQQDLIAVTIPETELAEIRASIAVLRGKLLPHLRTISAQDRLELPKMGDKTAAFVQKALEYGEQNRELLPGFLDFEALITDAKAVQLLREFLQGLRPLTEALEDSLMLSGSEAYQGALVFYASLKGAAKAKAPKAASIYEDLSARFPRSNGKKTPAAG